MSDTNNAITKIYASQDWVLEQIDDTTATLIGDTSVSEQISNALSQYVTQEQLDSKPGEVVTTTITNEDGSTTTNTGERFNFRNNTASGNYSHAEGMSTTASGVASHAEGTRTTASSNGSHAEGLSTTASGQISHAEGRSTTASGQSSHAEGASTIASGLNSHAEGQSTEASGRGSHAEGSSSVASGEDSHAEGYNTNAKGNYSHTEGDGTSTDSDAIIEGDSISYPGTPGYTSHAEGYHTIAKGGAAHAEGASSVASGNTSHAEGFGTVASGLGAHAEGQSTEASGDTSHAEGYKTIARECQHVQGKWNAEDTENKYAHIVGNGSTDTSRSNAHTLDWDGNAWFKGAITFGGTGQDDAPYEVIAVPKITEADNGKVLMVVNGQWQLVTLNLSVDENGVISIN